MHMQSPKSLKLGLHSTSYRFLLVFEGAPELLQFRRDRRARQLQGLDDVTCVASLLLCDEGVGIPLRGRHKTDRTTGMQRLNSKQILKKKGFIFKSKCVLPI